MDEGIVVTTGSSKLVEIVFHSFIRLQCIQDMDSALLGSNEIDDILKFPEFSVSLRYLATGRWAYESASAYL